MPKDTNKITLAAEHAEAWWQEQGKTVPPKDSPEYEIMCHQWRSFAFADFREDEL